MTDGQLLERFATQTGEAAELAFASLVERHGPMVLRACKGILRDDHEAMDAFQATFLVLIRKGRSLWVRDSLGPWLHRVACRAAARSHAEMRRRKAVERRAIEQMAGRTNDRERDDLAVLLHEEIDRLPERFRVPIVLCELEGHTCEQAARHIGCPIGTIGSRLVRGRERLRRGLVRRGVVPSVVTIGSALSSDANGTVHARSDCGRGPPNGERKGFACGRFAGEFSLQEHDHGKVGFGCNGDAGRSRDCCRRGLYATAQRQSPGATAQTGRGSEASRSVSFHE